jgi:PAS domain S-box-containing protein
MEKLPENATEIILESISEGVFTVDRSWRITSFNRAAEKITGVTRQEAMGSHCWEVFHSDMCESGCALKQTMEEKQPIVSRSAYIIGGDRRRIPITVSTALLRDASGSIIGGVETFKDISQVEALQKALSSTYQVGGMVSRSPAMQKIFALLPQVAASGSPVLIQGETGTGKELLARAIHDMSTRKAGPFVAVNCGALPDTLLESELFGYKAGAFTHAVRDKPGIFQTADGGTLLLDEIGDTTPAFQIKLLRVLQDHTFQPLGGTASIKTDIRAIAATNRDLSTFVAEERFRQDLFYRINVLQLRLPPLRERKVDIPLLCERIINQATQIRGTSVKGLSHEALAMLMSHDFPGNIRELENILEHAFILCTGGWILPEHLPEALQPVRKGAPQTSCGEIAEARQRAERLRIEEALLRHSGSRKAAASELGIHKSTLYRKIKALGIE